MPAPAADHLLSVLRSGLSLQHENVVVTAT
jgi:hypothetical protein